MVDIFNSNLKPSLNKIQNAFFCNGPVREKCCNVVCLNITVKSVINVVET